ncbi:MAG: hypothetical protein HDQ98_05050 [Lachnospiraceae bacterium]|nr:hypothetical protein [Lachnospiraceae bacterium]
MFKEAFITVLCFIGVYVILRVLIKKNILLAKRLIIGALALTLLLNICYNVYAFFPALAIDGVNYLGDAEDNLFIYNEKSEFRDQILFPTLQNRTVRIDESAACYALFFRTFAKSTETLSLTEDECAMLISAQDMLSFSAPLKIIHLMNYAFPSYAEISEVPILYLDESNLSGEDILVAASDDNGNLYLFTQKAYLEVTGYEQ